MNIDNVVASLTEDEAHEMLYKIRGRFGWAYALFDRSDVEAINGDEIDDDLWDAVTTTREWSDTLPEIMSDRGWDLVNDALESARRNIDNNKETP